MLKLKGRRTKITAVFTVLWNAACEIFPVLEPIHTPVNALMAALIAWFLHDAER